MTARLVGTDGAGLEAAIGALRGGGVVGLPTDTVYGIAVALDTPGGVERLFAIKGRPAERGIVLLVVDAEQAGAIGTMSRSAIALAATCWPGGLTLVVEQRPDRPLPAALTGGRPTIGLRVPDHPIPRAVASAVGPLPTTSANRSGLPEAEDGPALLAELGADLDVVIDGGPAAGGTASTVVDCTGSAARILRAGAISRERIAAVLAAASLDLDDRR